MYGTIFIHCQSFARKPNKVGQSVEQVILEGTRSGNCHGHVENPEPPTVLFGNPFAFQKMHDDHVVARKTRVTTGDQTSPRAIRSDRHTFFTIIASYPLFPSELGDQQQDYKRWEDLTVQWVKAQYGGQLKVVFLHLDEAYPHLHFWLLPDSPDADALVLHPGKLAKRHVELRLKKEGIAPRKAVQAGNRALKDRMRAWIDDYHLIVGAPCGLRRDGPRRRRLSRAQHQAETAMLAHHRELYECRAGLEREIALLAGVRAEEQMRVDTLEQQAAEALDKHNELEVLASNYLKDLQEKTDKLRRGAEQLRAAGPLMDAIAQEIADRTITFDPVSGWSFRDAEPFQRATFVWQKLSPAIKTLIDLVRETDEGRAAGQFQEPEKRVGQREREDVLRGAEATPHRPGVARSAQETCGVVSWQTSADLLSVSEPAPDMPTSAW